MTRPNAKTKKQNIRRNILNLAFLVLLVLVLLTGLLVTVVFPHDINEYENRYAEKIPRFRIASYRDGTFQDGVENALADQIPFAEKMKEAYNRTTSALTAAWLPRILAAKKTEPAPPDPVEPVPTNVPIFYDPDPVDPEVHLPQPDVPVQAPVYTAEKTNEGRVILSNIPAERQVPVYAALSKEISLFNNHLVYSLYPLNWMKPQFDKRAAALNGWMARHPEVTYYAYFIERETEIDLTTNEKSGTSDYMMKALNIPDENKSIFRVNSYAEYDEYYYKGDHHWNHKGSYEGYRQILGLLLPGVLPVEPTEVRSVGIGLGSKTMGAGAGYCEEMFGYVFDWPKFDVTINGDKWPCYGYIEDAISRTEKNPGAQKTTSYANLYGADNGCVVIRNPEAGNKYGNILLIGESYDNAVLRLLACHFDEVHAIDLRNYSAQVGGTFSFERYIRDNNITRILWNGCIDFWSGQLYNPAD